MRSNCSFPEPGRTAEAFARDAASSGEISRLMLAIKSALPAVHDVGSRRLLIFDEIDANVGGEIAHAVAGQMKTLGLEHQVICITHLPQVAAAASSQFVVTKEVAGGRDAFPAPGSERQSPAGRNCADVGRKRR